MNQIKALQKKKLNIRHSIHKLETKENDVDFELKALLKKNQKEKEDAESEWQETHINTIIESRATSPTNPTPPAEDSNDDPPEASAHTTDSRRTPPPRPPPPRPPPPRTTSPSHSISPEIFEADADDLASSDPVDFEIAYAALMERAKERPRVTSKL